MRVYCVSDIHVSFPANMKLIEDLMRDAGDRYSEDVLIVAGDVCEDLVKLRTVLQLFKSVFSRVFYCVGNHELWLTSEQDKKMGTSLDKFDRILGICVDLNVETRPAKVGNSLWIVPLHAWHEPGFDDTYVAGSKEWDSVKHAGDYVYCRWPDFISSELERGAVVKHFLKLNDAGINQVRQDRVDGDKVISFSHFLPRLDIMNRKWLFNPLLPRFVGSESLDVQIRSLGSNIHVFGHTHIDFDKVVDGVRYIQKSLGYPRERQMWKLAANDYAPNCIYE